MHAAAAAADTFGFRSAAILGGEVPFVVCIGDRNHSRRVSGSVARRRARRSWSVRAEPESRKQCNGRQGAVLAPSALHQGQNGWQKRVLRRKLALEPIPWGLGSPGAVVVAPVSIFALYDPAGRGPGLRTPAAPRRWILRHEAATGRFHHVQHPTMHPSGHHMAPEAQPALGVPTTPPTRRLGRDFQPPVAGL